MGSVNWTVVIVVALICYTLYAIADIGNEAREIKADLEKSESSTAEK